MTSRSVLLLATNKTQYLEFAINCAQSVKLHNPGLPLFIATNIQIDINISGVKFLYISEQLARLHIEAKLYLDTLLQTEETLFIDDNLRNEQAARDIGLQTVHFKSADQLKEDLVQLGIL